MLIKNAQVYTIEHRFDKLDVSIENQRISNLEGEMEISDASEMVIDAEGLYAIPGLVDIHFHGAKGHDFCDASHEQLLEIAEYEAQNGILAICPATMSYNEEILSKLIDKAVSYQESKGASFIGINMEGPFINPKKAGAQNPEYIMMADMDMFLRLLEKSNGLIKLVDVAPEFETNMEFIEKISDRVCVSIAHTLCDYETAREAFQKGAKHMTHLYNAMPEITHREPGPILAALEMGANVELIADGIHVHPAVVRMTFQLFGADRIILISDSMEATGLSDGEYKLGGQAVTVSGKKAILSNQPEVIAGSVSNLFDCMRNCVFTMGIPLEQAIQAATENPARAIGVEKEYGRIAVGNYANLLLVDRELQIHHMIQKGQIIKGR